MKRFTFGLLGLGVAIATLPVTPLEAAEPSGTLPVAQPSHAIEQIAHSEMHQGEMHPDSMHHEGGHGGEHSHGSMEIPAGQPVPTVDLIIHPDAQRGWNLEIQVTNFRFAPESVNLTSLPSEGHAHLYVNGVKLTRLYGNWYYLESLPPGEHDITVGLNANGHEDLLHNGQPIQDTERLIVPPQ